MDTQTLIKNLHPLEVKVLLSYSDSDELTAERLQKELEYKEGHANQAFSWLSGKGLLELVRKEQHIYFELTDLGRSYAEKGTPEQRIVAFLTESGAHTLPEIAKALQLENKDVGSAFGQLSKDGVAAMNSEKKASVTGAPFPERVTITASLLKKAVQTGILDKTTLSDTESAVIQSLAKKRGAADAPFRLTERETAVYRLSAKAADVAAALRQAGVTGNELGAVTSQMLISGSWKQGTFRGYNISVPPARIIPGRTNPYVSFLESVKDKLCSLGFEEFDGPLVETEFWNSDALFMPQFHAARDIHDAYYVKNPTHAKWIDEPFLSNVAAAHENGGNTGSRGWIRNR